MLQYVFSNFSIKILIFLYIVKQSWYYMLFIMWWRQLTDWHGDRFVDQCGFSLKNKLKDSLSESLLEELLNVVYQWGADLLVWGETAGRERRWRSRWTCHGSYIFWSESNVTDGVGWCPGDVTPWATGTMPMASDGSSETADRIKLCLTLDQQSVFTGSTLCIDYQNKRSVS